MTRLPRLGGRRGLVIGAITSVRIAAVLGATQPVRALPKAEQDGAEGYGPGCQGDDLPERRFSLRLSEPGAIVAAGAEDKDGSYCDGCSNGGGLVHGESRCHGDGSFEKGIVGGRWRREEGITVWRS